ncbi:MAG: S9 family peptidase [Bacteroidales bacterium]|nr:S9 family peptidase [Bacteroidales bacterium]
MNKKCNALRVKLSRLCILLVCFAVGYGIDMLINHHNMKNNSDQQYIGPADASSVKSFTPETLLSLGRLSDPQVSPAGGKVIYGVSYTDIKANRSCRNLYLLDLAREESIQLTRDASSISCARWIDADHIAFIQNGQIVSAGLSRSGKALRCRRVLSDIPEGISEFTVSPDGKKVMFVTSVDGWAKTPDKVYPDITGAEAYRADDLMYRHWDHYTDKIPHTFVAALDPLAKKSITLDNSSDILVSEPYELPAEPFSGIEQLCWSPDSRYIAYSCRKLTGKKYAYSTNAEIFVYDTESPKTIRITRGGGYDTTPVWAPDGRHIAWLSMERDGYEADKSRLMCVEVEDSCEFKVLSHPVDLSACFAYNVDAPVWAKDGESIWFSSLCEGLQGIFKVNLSGEVTRLTAEDDWHDYSTPFCECRSGKIYSTWMSMDAPTEIVCIENGVTTQITHENDAILAACEGITTEKRMIRTVDGKDMLTWVLYPPHFSPDKVYPAIEICLGGPQGTLSQDWSYRWNYRLMASQGYIVILPNRRGTTAFGQEWCEQISGDYCGLNMQDYLSAAKALKAEPYVGKIAACGASYGGYSVYYLSGIHGDTFDCFIAHAGIFNEEHMYYTTEEMWFPQWDNGGSPWSKSPKAVRHYENSPHKLIRNWHTPILCIHGGSDFRVPYDEGMAAFNCAQMMGVPSRLIIFPNENHWILKPQNALYWHREYFSWLDQWCK